MRRGRGRPAGPVAAAVLLSALLQGAVPVTVASAQEPGAPDVACAVPAPAGAPAERPGELTDAHRIATGEGVRVAVIDTGVADHPQLREVVPGGDLVTPDFPQPLLDCDGHGTVVAGIIAARDAGVAPDATVISVRQSSAHHRRPGAEGEDAAGTLASLGDGVHRALDAGADVINVSVVSCVPAETADRLDTTPLDDALHRAEAEGAVVVAAAGNQGRDCQPGAVVYPAYAPTVLAVAALDATAPLALAGYSLPAGDPDTALAAPGEMPVGLSPDGVGWATGMHAPGQHEVVPFTGTSFATPVVSGAVALLRQRHPHESAAQLRDRVTGGAQPGHGVVEPHRVLTHLAADYTVDARVRRVAAPPTPERRARAASLAVMGGLGALVLGGVLAAGVIRRPR